MEGHDYEERLRHGQLRQSFLEVFLEDFNQDFVFWNPILRCRLILQFYFIFHDKFSETDFIMSIKNESSPDCLERFMIMTQSLVAELL